MTENAPVTFAIVNPDEAVTNKIFVTIQGQDFQKDFDSLGLTFDSPEQEIMDRIAPIIQEEYGEDIRDLYKVRKSVNNHNIFVIPNSVAGLSK